MSAHCHSDSCTSSQAVDPRYRRILWIALALNLAMFIVELAAGLASGSVSLLADAIDFFGDAANYGVSLAVLSMALVIRAKAALLKAACMLGFGLFVLGKAAWSARAGIPPEAITMGVVGFMALCVNVGVAAMLYAYRNGDANMQSVWLCSRNDALSNIAVILAAFGVFGTASAWPDVIVAGIMGLLAISSAFTVLNPLARN
jgi:Co/Zn/Cd efflux system component